MSKRLKDFPVLTPLASSTEMPVGDGTADTGYKTTLNDIKTYIGTVPIPSPLTVDEGSAPVASAGTITWTKASNVATVSSATDHGNLAVNDVILLSGVAETYVVSIGVFPYITILGTYADVTTLSFSYVQPSYIARDAAGTTNTVISQGGVMTTGSVVSNSPSSLKGDVNVSGNLIVDYTTHTDRLRSTDGAYSTRLQNDDGMFTTPYRPGFNSGMTADYNAVPAAVWTKVPFNLVNGADSSFCTFTRVPVGASGYDTANYLFAVPYIMPDYPETLYTFSASLYLQLNCPIPTCLVVVAIVGVSDTAWTNPIELAREISTTTVTHTLITQSIDVTRTVKLRPPTVPRHKYIGVRLYHTFNTLNIVNGTYNASHFSGICHG